MLLQGAHGREEREAACPRLWRKLALDRWSEPPQPSVQPEFLPEAGPDSSGLRRLDGERKLRKTSLTLAEVASCGSGRKLSLGRGSASKAGGGSDVGAAAGDPEGLAERSSAGASIHSIVRADEPAWKEALPRSSRARPGSLLRGFEASEDTDCLARG